MSVTEEQPNVFTYLDRVTGTDGIKTTNKLDVSVDKQTKIFLVGLGLGLVVFSKLLSLGVEVLAGQTGRRA